MPAPADWLNWIAHPDGASFVALLFTKLTLLLAGAWLVHMALRQAGPHWRVLLWRATAVGMILLPATMLIAPVIELHVPMAGAGSAGSAADGTAAAGSAWLARWGWMIAVWCVGAAVLTLRLVVGVRRLRRLLAVSERAPGQVTSRCARMASQMGCETVPKVRMVRGLSVPFVTHSKHFEGPVLLLPARMVNPLYRSELPGVLAHELSHLRSHDLGWGYVLHVLATLLWFHPLAWKLTATHAAACEERTDAASATVLGDTAGYMRTLARVAVQMATSPGTVMLAPLARVSQISRRLGILERRGAVAPPARQTVLATALVGVLALAGLAGLTCVADPTQPPDAVAATPADAIPSPAADHSSSPPRKVVQIRHALYVPEYRRLLEQYYNVIDRADMS